VVSRFFAIFAKVYSAKFFKIIHHAKVYSREIKQLWWTAKVYSLEKCRFFNKYLLKYYFFSRYNKHSIGSIHFEHVFLQGVFLDKMNFETKQFWSSAKKTQCL